MGVVFFLGLFFGFIFQRETFPPYVFYFQCGGSSGTSSIARGGQYDRDFATSTRLGFRWGRSTSGFGVIRDAVLCPISVTSNAEQSWLSLQL